MIKRIESSTLADLHGLLGLVQVVDGEIYFITDEVVYRVQALKGTIRPSWRVTPEDVVAWRTAREGGLTYRQIADLTGFNYVTIYKHLTGR